MYSSHRFDGAALPVDVLNWHDSGVIRAVSCRQLLDELVDIARYKLDLSTVEAIELIRAKFAFVEIVEVPGVLHGVSSDPDDDVVIECAVVAGATHIVTGDKRHLLPLKRYENIDIVSAAAFLELVSGR